MAENTIPISLWLSGRDYRIRINPEDEEAVRKAVKVAEERLKELKQSYQGKDEQDFLAMCLLLYATDAVSDDNKADPIQRDYIQSMLGAIDKALGKEAKEEKVNS